jgi:hypothetical protein
LGFASTVVDSLDYRVAEGVSETQRATVPSLNRNLLRCNLAKIEIFAPLQTPGTWIPACAGMTVIARCYW